ncbi:YibE/F family protein [Varibaculum prostatecancerukia]|uniref:YibE/F family protein n=1 Tax=Varibaculum prostatecancerukia TaxID=2811781 RepID=UPI001C00710A|nr:YibE/F family protein [Varibaculum prostatecancerukia]
MHQHLRRSGHSRPDPQSLRRARRVLTALIVPVLLAIIIGIVTLYSPKPLGDASQDWSQQGTNRLSGQVTGLDGKKCLIPGLKMPKGAADPTNGMPETQPLVCVKVLEGQWKDKIVPVRVPEESKSAIRVGTAVWMLYDTEAMATGTPFLFTDIKRGNALAIMAVLYVIIVVAVAGRRGFLALLGLLASTLVIVFFMLPALMAGQPPMLVTLAGVGAIMFLSVYLAHGITIRTTTALLGTILGLVVTVLLAYAGTRAAGLTGASDEDALILGTQLPALALPSLFMCGIVVAGLGALNDVTITQASAVWELDEANPQMPRRKLFSRAMRIGRDHIASTVYTLAFAYVGTALPTLILAMLSQRPFLELLTVSQIAEEIVRTLVASIGLVLAIPATTVVGTFLVKFVRASSGSVADLHSSSAKDSRVKEQVEPQTLGGDATTVVRTGGGRHAH